MTRPECSIDGCDSPARARGWCKNHHQRWLRHGDPLGGGRRFATPEESFRARTAPANDGSGCILWTGSKAPTGHGIIGGLAMKFERMGDYADLADQPGRPFWEAQDETEEYRDEFYPETEDQT